MRNSADGAGMTIERNGIPYLEWCFVLSIGWKGLGHAQNAATVDRFAYVDRRIEPLFSFGRSAAASHKRSG